MYINCNLIQFWVVVYIVDYKGFVIILIGFGDGIEVQQIGIFVQDFVIISVGIMLLDYVIFDVLFLKDFVGFVVYFYYYVGYIWVGCFILVVI